MYKQINNNITDRTNSLSPLSSARMSLEKRSVFSTSRRACTTRSPPFSAMPLSFRLIAPAFFAGRLPLNSLAI